MTKLKPVTIRVLLPEPATLHGAAGVVSLHEDIASAVAEAYANAKTHLTYLVRDDALIVLDATVRGAGQHFDALIKAEKEAAAKKTKEQEDRALLRSLLSKYPDEVGGER